MTEPSTFDETDWNDLSMADKKALRRISQVATDYEPLAKMAGVGQKSMDSLIDKNLAVEGAASRHGARTFKLTDKGWLAVNLLNGQK